ncbi:MAG: DUF4159 domain-containing protein [Gemmatimonadota bacterium]|nr:DUF4159 domain-containing protein [Gemmatimonadota bacterium]
MFGLTAGFAISAGAAAAWLAPSGAGATVMLQEGATGLQEGVTGWTCERGPRGYGDMEVTPEGYVRAPPGEPTRPHQFYLVRAIYSERSRFGGRRSGGAWAIDYPAADRVMTRVATRLSNLDACPWEKPISLADPQLRRHPFVYTVEWGRGADLTDAEVRGLRDYLRAGGFLMVDDFWGTREWQVFEEQIRRVLPDREIVEVPRDHPVFRSYYDIDGDIVQVPGIRDGRAITRGWSDARTHQRDGYEAHLRGIFDDDGRLMVAINWNTDLGDALEWAESPEYPLEYSTFASRLFLNLIVYAMAY